MLKEDLAMGEEEEREEVVVTLKEDPALKEEEEVVEEVVEEEEEEEEGASWRKWRKRWRWKQRIRGVFSPSPPQKVGVPTALPSPTSPSTFPPALYRP